MNESSVKDNGHQSFIYNRSWRLIRYVIDSIGVEETLDNEVMDMNNEAFNTHG